MVYTFNNTRTVMKAGKLCYQHSIDAKVIPTPRNISSDCGVSLRVSADNAEVVEELFAGEGFVFKKHNG